MRLLPAAALVMLAAAAVLEAVEAPVRFQQDATTVLAAARAALGGDALLNRITSLTVNGSSSEDLGRVSIGKSVEISLQLPDKFLMMKRHTVHGPPGVGGMDFSITDYDGFNGGTTLDAVISSGGPMPPFTPYAAAMTPAELQALAERRLRLQKEGFARFMLPLFAASPAALPLQF